MAILPFANREKEWNKIEGALVSLLDPGQFLRDAIVEFYGVSGIGKSTLLLRAARECLDRDIWYAFVDFEERVNGDKGWPHVVKDISTQLGLPESVPGEVSTYIQTGRRWDKAIQSVFINAMVHLLRDQGRPVVLFFDTLDRADEESLRWLEYTLRDLIDVGHLLVVLGSKTLVTFESTREVTRKLRPYRLHPFSLNGTREQLEQLVQIGQAEESITDELLTDILDEILSLTAGHPLANKVVFDAFLYEGLDPRQAENRDTLVDVLFKRVIERWILADIKPQEQREYGAILPPLAVPRQFNLEMMRELIGRFAPEEYALPSGVAYMDLVGRIRQDTFLIEWDSSKQGYAMDPTIRRIFSLWLRVQDPHRFDEISRWLADTYERWITEVSGSDRVRYILERLYHMSHLEKEQVQETLANYFDRLYADETFDHQVQLLEELRADGELQEALGEGRFEEMVEYLQQRIRR